MSYLSLNRSKNFANYINILGFISVIIFLEIFSFLGESISIFHSGIPGLFESISFKNLVEFTRANYSIFSLIINLEFYLLIYPRN